MGKPMLTSVLMVRVKTVQLNIAVILKAFNAIMSLLKHAPFCSC